MARRNQRHGADVFYRGMIPGVDDIDAGRKIILCASRRWDGCAIRDDYVLRDATLRVVANRLRPCGRRVTFRRRGRTFEAVFRRDKELATVTCLDP